MSGISAKHKEINRNIFNPKLRFVNFSKEWNEINFGNTFDFKQTNSLSRDKLNYEDGKVKNIHYGDIHTKFHSNFYIDKENVPYINKDIDLNKIDSENYCKENDLIIADASEDYLDIGKSIEIRKLDNQKVLSGLHTLIARPKSNYFSQGILGYLMRSRTVRLQIMILAQGTKVLGISPKYLNKIIFKLPELSEQQKIAEFLESTDNWIENLREQKQSLELYKKGMMQKIFAQEIRFKDENGKEFPEWEEKKLGDLFLERTEKKCNKDLELLSVTTNSGVSQQISSNKRDISSINKSNYKVVYINDIVYNTMRMWQGASGVSQYVGFVSPAYTVVHLKTGCIDFYKYLFKQSRVIFDFYRYSQGLTSDTWNLKFHHFSDVVVTVSININEQQKIAEFLTSIDNLINSKQQQIAKAEEWKKGLMQGLFV